jgi:hypothetical protein
MHSRGDIHFVCLEIKLSKFKTALIFKYTVDNLQACSMDTYITQNGATLTIGGGQVLAMGLDNIDNSTNTEKTVSNRRWSFSSDFLEHRVIEFIISTFCIPLL